MNASLLTVGLCLAAQTATAAVYTDSFDTINPAWTTDRYAPAQFDSIADPTPRNDGNVLRIAVDDADSQANRPGSFSSAFYNTQGRSMSVSTGPTWSVSADVYIDASWDPTLGNARRTGLWTRDSNPVENDSNYPIFGFLSQDSAFTIRAFDSQVGWQNLSTASFNGFGSWNNIRIEATGSSFDYYLNGSLLWSDTTTSDLGSEDLSRVFLQAYNFGEGGYEVLWDNLNVTPTPGALSLLAFGALTTTRRRRS